MPTLNRLAAYFGAGAVSGALLYIALRSFRELLNDRRAPFYEQLVDSVGISRRESDRVRWEENESDDDAQHGELSGDDDEERSGDEKSDSWADLDTEQRRIHEQWLSRTTALLGERSMQRIARRRLCVIGQDAVAEHCAHHCVRSGLRRLVMMGVRDDNVYISSESLRRRALCGADDVGRRLCDVLAERFVEIAGDTLDFAYVHCVRSDRRQSVVAACEWLRRNAASIDAVCVTVASLRGNAMLMAACAELHLPVISVLHSSSKRAARNDMTRIEVDTPYSHFVDSVAGTARRLCVKHNVVDIDPLRDASARAKTLEKNTRIVFCGINLTMDEGARHSSPLLDAAFGCTAAAELLQMLASPRCVPLPLETYAEGQLHKVVKRMRRTYRDDYKREAPPSALCAYIYVDVWHCRSAISGERLDERACLAVWFNQNLQASDWETQELRAHNFIILKASEARVHLRRSGVDSVTEPAFGVDELQVAADATHLADAAYGQEYLQPYSLSECVRIDAILEHERVLDENARSDAAALAVANER